MKCERTGMRKAVQNFLSFDKRGDRCPVFFLVQEKACLLSFLHIHHKPDAVLSYFNHVRNLTVQEACCHLKSFQFPDRNIISFPDTLRMHFLHKGINNIFLETLHSKGETLQNKNIRK